MANVGRWRWGQVLLPIAVLLGVVAMHCLVTSGGGGPDMSVGAMASPAPVAGPVTSSVEHAPDPMPGSHAGMLHLCLAVLLLGLALVVVLTYRDRAAAPRVSRVGPVPPRPPSRMAVRLAQLCVLRN